MKKLLTRPYGLKARLGLTLLLSGILCAAVFLMLFFLSDAILTNYFENSAFEEIHIERQGQNLQAFVEQNELSSKDLQTLSKWEKRQPIILLELYSEDGCIYSSLYDDVELGDIHEEDEMPELDTNAFPISLADMDVVAFLHSDFTYQYFLFGRALSFALALALFILLFIRSNRQLIRYICKLNDEVQILEGGNLDYQVSVQGNDEITDLARSMNRMKESIRDQMENEQRLYKANRQLISEMSHDLRTPLTGIMLYLEILKMHRYETDEQLQDYLDKIDAKARHMKLLSDHLFEYTLDSASIKQENPALMENAFSDVLYGLVDDLKTHGFAVSSEIEWKPYYVRVRTEYLSRIFENILSNILKYAQKDAGVRIETIYALNHCGFSVINTCRQEPSPVESSHIGIESIKTLMKQMGGICTVEQTESVFEISILFPLQ